MADFEKAYKAVMSNEGASANHTDSNTEHRILLCSDCFCDEGLKIDAFLIGKQDNLKCPNCKSENGHKLSKALVQQLCYRFFVIGTIQRFEYGGCPLIQFNEQHFNQSDIDVSPWLTDDVKLIEQAGEIGLFYYGSRFWMCGEVEPLKSLQDETERNQMIDKI